MANLSLRGCDEDLVRALKELSARDGLSVNRLILKILKDALLGAGKKPLRYDDLDSLAGTWTAAEADAFDNDTSSFGQIDNELWNP
jgi:hypothetical protein